jgi:Protein of unknown function (DUF732)
MNAEQWPFGQPTFNYPEPPRPVDPTPRQGVRPLLVVLVTLAVVLFVIAVMLVGFAFMHARHNAPMTMPAPVTTTVTATPQPPADPDKAFIAALRMQGWPVIIPEDMPGIGKSVCDQLAHGGMNNAVQFLATDNAPFGWNRGDAIAFIWAAEDSYCPDQPRQ